MPYLAQWLVCVIAGTRSTLPTFPKKRKRKDSDSANRCGTAVVNLHLALVEISGIELLTSWMPFRHSPSWTIPRTGGNQRVSPYGHPSWMQRNFDRPDPCFWRMTVGRWSPLLWARCIGVSARATALRSHCPRGEFPPYRRPAGPPGWRCTRIGHSRRFCGSAPPAVHWGYSLNL